MGKRKSEKQERNGKIAVQPRWPGRVRSDNN